MKKIIKEGLFILGIYTLLIIYLLFAGNRIERLEKIEKEDNLELVNVRIHYNR